MDGSDLSIAWVGDGGAVVAITDGERLAVYQPLNAEPLSPDTLHIVPAYVEAGWFSEANCVTLTDGERTVLYVPLMPQPS